MADIDASLKRALDGPAPQHKVEGRQEFEFTEGKDGSLNVRDSELLSELELIKAQQTQILERLDGDFNTQLTGSNVEDENAIPVKQTNGITIIETSSNDNVVLPRETIELTSVSKMKYTGIYVMFQSQHSQDTWELIFQPKRGTSDILGSETIKSTSFGTLQNFQGVSSFAVRLKNTRDEAQTLRRFEIGGKYFESNGN